MRLFVRAASAIAAMLVSSQVSSYASHTTEVWVGAPATGAWPAECTSTYPSNTCSVPKYHWDVDSNNDGVGNDGNWSADLRISGGTRLYLYVAPQITSDVITTKVEKVSDACKFPGNGGKMVRIAVYKGTSKIGQIIYMHLTPNTTPIQGTTISRWGGYLGTVASGLPVNPLCWKGAHVHFEMYNQANYACYFKRISFVAKNFLGFMGGNRVSGNRMPCP